MDGSFAKNMGTQATKVAKNLSNMYIVKDFLVLLKDLQQMQ